jgi:hypothetical protein
LNVVAGIWIYAKSQHEQEQVPLIAFLGEMVTKSSHLCKKGPLKMRMGAADIQRVSEENIFYMS